MVRIVQLGTPRHKNEGVRIGTVRRPPRGVPKADFAKRDFYDVWLPLLSPSADLVKFAMAKPDAAGWKTFIKKFRSEIENGEGSKILDLLATLSHSSNFSVGCYCEDETRCHRSVLRELLKARGAEL